MEMKPISVSKEELNEDLFEDVLFFKFAEGGAMGEPGGVVWVKANGESYHCNYCYGDVRYEDLLKLFAPLKKCSFGMFGLGSTVPGEWKYVSLGNAIKNATLLQNPKMPSHNSPKLIMPTGVPQ